MMMKNPRMEVHRTIHPTNALILMNDRLKITLLMKTKKTKILTVNQNLKDMKVAFKA